MNTKLKNNKGITLIALVITIIVLLILAGISIAMLTGNNGILTQANEAKEENIQGSEEERIKLAYNNLQIKKNLNEITEINAENLKNQMISDGEKEENIETEYYNVDKSIAIYFNDSKNDYTMDSAGNVYKTDENLKFYAYTYKNNKIVIIGTVPTLNFKATKFIYTINGEEKEVDSPNAYKEAIVDGISLKAEELGCYRLVATTIKEITDFPIRISYSVQSNITEEWIETEELVINNLEEINKWGDWY